MLKNIRPEGQFVHTNPDGSQVDIQLIGTTTKREDISISPSAYIGEGVAMEGEVTIEENVSVGVNSFLKNVLIADEVTIGALCHINGKIDAEGSRTIIDSNTRIGNNTAINDDIGIACTIGHRNMIYSKLPNGTRIGHDNHVNVPIFDENMGALTKKVRIGNHSWIEVGTANSADKPLTGLIIGDNVKAALSNISGNVEIGNRARFGWFMHARELQGRSSIHNATIPYDTHIPASYDITEDTVILVLPDPEETSADPITVIIQNTAESFWPYSKKRCDTPLTSHTLNALFTLYKQQKERHEQRVKTLEGRARKASQPESSWTGDLLRAASTS